VNDLALALVLTSYQIRPIIPHHEYRNQLEAVTKKALSFGKPQRTQVLLGSPVPGLLCSVMDMGAKHEKQPLLGVDPQPHVGSASCGRAQGEIATQWRMSVVLGVPELLAHYFVVKEGSQGSKDL
jgi:hypothetical protein